MSCSWTLGSSGSVGTPGPCPGRARSLIGSGPHVSARWGSISGKSVRVRRKRVHRSRGPNPLVRRASPRRDGPVGHGGPTCAPTRPTGLDATLRGRSATDASRTSGRVGRGGGVGQDGWVGQGGGGGGGGEGGWVRTGGLVDGGWVRTGRARGRPGTGA